MTRRERQAAEDRADALTEATRQAYAAAAAVVEAHGIDSPEAAAAHDAACELRRQRDAAWEAADA